MSIRDIILASVETNKLFDKSQTIIRCITAAVDYSDSAASYRRPGYTWVKQWGQDRVFEAFNPTGKNAPDLPVLVYNLPKPPFMKAIYSVDWETYSGAFTNPIGTNPGVGNTNHALKHVWYDSYQGQDALRVYMRMIASMQGYVYSGLTIAILPGYYLYNGEERYCPGGYVDLTSLIPAVDTQIRVLIYYDTLTQLFGTTASAAVALTGAPSWPLPPQYAFPIVWVLLKDTDTTLNEYRLNDARALWTMTTEADAVSIQGIPVSDVNPTEGQVLVYRGLYAQYEPETPAAGVAQEKFFTVEGDLSIVSNPLRIYNLSGVNRTISKVFCSVDTAPAGDDAIMDLLEDGVTIFTNPANRPVILDGANTGFTTTIDNPTWSDGSYLTMAIAQIGSGTPGANLTLHVVYT